MMNNGDDNIYDNDDGGRDNTAADVDASAAAICSSINDDDDDDSCSSINNDVDDNDGDNNDGDDDNDGGNDYDGDDDGKTILIRVVVDGAWTSFSLDSTSQCSQTCGTGSQVLTFKRSCTNPEPQYGGRTCEGSDTDEREQSCNPDPCPS